MRDRDRVERGYAGRLVTRDDAGYQALNIDSEAVYDGLAAPSRDDHHELLRTYCVDYDGGREDAT